MANFAINIGAAANEPPSIIGSMPGITINWGEDYVFTVANFSSETVPPYSDPEGDLPSLITFYGFLPTVGTLTLNSVAITLGQDITVADINSGLLKYESDQATLTTYLDTWNYDVADAGSGTYNPASQINGWGFGNIRVLAKVNLPPTEVGDGDETIAYGESLTFTRAMFTTDTTPPYSDPEGDAALNLKILSLPTDGTLKLNGVNVVINQIIPFADIDSSLFTFVPSLVDTDGDIETFTFEIADAGSGTFVP